MRRRSPNQRRSEPVIGCARSPRLTPAGRRTRRDRCRPAGALLFLLVWLAAAPVQADEPLRIVVLDVGEGQSVLLQQGEHGVLVDAGHAGQARHILDRLEAHGVHRLDYLILTHLHPDHATGYFRLREAFPRAPVIDNGQEIPRDFTPDSVRWVHEALVDDPHRRVVGAGDVIEWQAAELRVLWPQVPEGLDLNHNSLVIEVEFGELSALIMGDAYAEAESRLLEQGRLPERVGLLVAGHHGSERASSEAFVAAASPAVSAISTNADNFRGYPDPAVVRRLREHSGRLYRTFAEGEVCLQWGRADTEPRVCPAVP